MPDLTSIASTLRAGKFTFTGYIATIPRTVVLEGTVSAVPSYPALQVSYTLDDGSESDVIQDMTVDFFSSTGVLKATLRIASGQTVTSTVLPVNEFSAGVYDVASGDTFKVYEEWRIKDRLVSATAELNKDSRITLTDQLTSLSPICNSGGVSVGFTTSRSFAGDTSFAVDPDSGGTLTHAWDFIDATPSTSTSTNPSSIVFPVGFRTVKHTTTDSSNSKSTVQEVPTWVFNKSTYQPLRVQVDNLSEQIAGGRITFKLPYGTEGDIENLPDGAWIVYFEREYRNNTENSYGSNVSNRSNVKFSGYLIRDSISIDADENTVSFEAISTMGILEQTPALPQLMTNGSGKWSDIPNLTTKQMLWYIAKWGASVQTAWDFVWTDSTEIEYERIAVEGQTIAEQLRDIANGINVDMTCDSLGRIQFIRDPNYLTEVQRAARTTTYDFTTADIIKIEFTREHQGSVKTVRGEGITSSNAPVFSNAPGNAPASLGIGSDTLSKQIVSSQSQLNDRTGYHFARVNSLYNGRFVPRGLRLTVPDGYDVIQCANREFVTITLPASTNTRGISFADTERWTVEGKDITYDLELGTKDIVYTLDHETSGVAGTTYIPPQEGDNGLPEQPPIDVDFPSVGVDPGTGLGIDPGTTTPAPTSPSTKTMAAFCSDNNMYLTANFPHPESSGGPTWEPTDLTALSGWGGGDLIAFEYDPYSPAYIGTGDEVNGVLLTDEMVQRIEDIFGTPTLGSAYTFADASTARTMAIDRNLEGFGIVASWVAGDGVYAAVTLDGGLTWAEDLITAFENTDAGGIAPGVWISPHTAGKAYISVWTATGDNATAEASVYKTTNSGTSWSLLASPDIDSGVDVSSFIGVPFSNTAASRVFHRKKDGDGLHLIRNVAGVETDITPEISSLAYVPVGQRGHEIALPDEDSNALAMIGVTGIASGLVITTELDLPGTEFNYDTGIAILSGDPLVITASGTWCYASGYPASCSDADGVPGNFGSGATMPGEQLGALIGKIGAGGTWFLIGSSYSDTAAASGNLYLADNDGDNIDNAGFQHVTIEHVDNTDGTIIYGLMLTDNVQAEEPTWDALEVGEEFPYRQIVPIGSGKYLVYGIEGSIGVTKTSGIDSRKGNIPDGITIVGSCAI